jgi:hypothetical protein
MNLEASIYTPRASSLAASVIAFFRKHNEEELHITDIALKFDAPKESVHAALKEAVALGILKRNNTLYCAGAAIAASREEPAAGTDNSDSKPAKVSYRSPRKHIDFAALVIDDGVPYIAQAKKNGNKYDPLFARLTKAGQSTNVPGSCKGALAAAIAKRNKTGQGSFKVSMTSATEARVWRIA